MQVDFNGSVDEVEQRLFPTLYSLGLVALVPQVITTFLVLIHFWTKELCDRPLREWALGQGLLLTTFFILGGYQLCSPSPPAVAMQVCGIATGALQLFTLGWFVVGNVWVFTSQTCATQAPHIFRITLLLLILEYVVLFFPLLMMLVLFMGALFCLPFAVVAMLGSMLLHPRGLRRSDLARLPSVRYHPADAGDEGWSHRDCAVCLAQYEEGEELRVMPQCRHRFHRECIDQWLVVNATCPVCRSQVSAPTRPPQASPAAAPVDEGSPLLRPASASAPTPPVPNARQPDGG